MNHTLRLIEQVERLNMSGEIGDGMVARLHELAALARLEQSQPGCGRCVEREAAREQSECECG